MLRLLVLLLILGNGAYLAWTSGLLAPYGLAPAVQSEPQRVAQQIRPEALTILSPIEARLLEGAAPDAPAESVAPTTTTSLAAASRSECLQAGLFSEVQSAALRTRLQSELPAGSWVLESRVTPARWMVYMGKYSSPEALTKKKGALRKLNVPFEALNNAELEPGLSLGSFASRPEADTAMAGMVKRGVRTAKVIEAQPELRGQQLKLAAVDASLRSQLKAMPQLGGKALQACS